MMRKRKSVLKQVAILLYKNISKFIDENGLSQYKEKIIKDIFGTKRIKNDCRLLEDFENRNEGYIIIPVIVKKSDKKRIESLIKINREMIKEILSEIEERYSGGGIDEEDIEEEIIKEMCLFGECEEEHEDNKTKRKRDRRRKQVKNETDTGIETDTETIETETPQSKKRRGRPKKTKSEEKIKNVDNEIIDEGDNIETIDDEENIILSDDDIDIG
jgi:hypothetical protein